MDKRLLKPYDPKETEGKIYKIWEKSGFFNPDKLPEKRKKTFTIPLPPPNITGSLHLGHALNATIQDILIRQKRMIGYKTLWLPGIDHAGIATQNIVEKELRKEGLTRHDLGREKFLEKVWEWKEKYGHIILDQLKKLRASCDWSRTRFTMDKEYAKAVETAFFHYYKKGLIYQGERVINWCTRCQTSLSDLELEYKDSKSKLWFIKYPLEKGGFIAVATTRPETMLGDTAVAVHPSDKRYKKLIGQKALLPIQERLIPIIPDRRVDPKFGTGAVKVTPAHSFTDFEIGQEQNLKIVKVIDRNGRMTREAGKNYEGLKVIEAREKIIKELGQKNLLEKTEDYDNYISHCYRCDSIIEPQISKQWFLKMKDLAETAKWAVKDGKIKFHPKKWEKIYFDWLDNIRDWCISRQLWWGHKIPLNNVDDVLDTWFSSALWPFATMSKSDQKIFYPAQILSTARDIINLWVARMVFSGYEFMGEKPFSDVIIHPTILTREGKRMSKSLGTGIDPMVLIEKYGADSTRFGLIFQTMGGQDIHFTEDHVLAGKKFCNKIWNATRFALEHSKKSKSEKHDKVIIEKLNKVTKSVDKNIKEYKFGQALHLIYDFFWHDFCDKYIEESKSGGGTALLPTLATSLKLLHPFMPFITEEIWSMLPGKGKNLLIIEKWPKI